MAADWLAAAAHLGALVGPSSDDLRGSVERTAAVGVQQRVPPEAAGQAEVGQLESEEGGSDIISGGATSE